AFDLRPDAADRVFDPGLSFFVDFPHVSSLHAQWPADDDPYGPAALPQTAARPVVAGIVRDGDDQTPGLLRQKGAAHTVAARLARRHARAFREDHDPVSLGKALLTLLDHLA